MRETFGSWRRWPPTIFGYRNAARFVSLTIGTSAQSTENRVENRNFSFRLRLHSFQGFVLFEPIGRIEKLRIRRTRLRVCP